jgi:hypothetical protein
MFLDKEGFCKEGFFLKIVSNMERKDKDKPSKDLEGHMKVSVSVKSVQ